MDGQPELERRVALLTEEVAALRAAVGGLEERVRTLEGELARAVEQRVWELLRGLRLR